MNNKFLKIIAAVFLVLILITIFPWIKEKISSQQAKQPANLSVNLSGFTKESVNKISIKKGLEEKILSFKDGKWLIGEDEADESKVDQLFSDFSNLKIGEVASQNEANFGKFEVNADTGTQLTITQNGKDSLFFIGKAGAAATDFYMRKDGIKNVYSVSGTLRDDLAPEAASWKKPEAKEEEKK